MAKANKYNFFSEENSKLPIFLQPWWLDIVCEGNGWNVSASFNDQGGVQSVLPFMKEKKGPFLLLRMPPLTPFLGVWIAPFKGEKLHQKYSYEKKVMDDLINGLPDFHYFAQKFSPEITNWYPFFLNGFEQTTSYTYVINQIKDHDAVWGNMKNTVRTVIRKAESLLKIEETDDIDQHLELQKETFVRQGIKMPFPENIPKRIFNEVSLRNQGSLFKAVDKEGNVHATCLMVWDDEIAYNLMMGVDTDLRSSGAVQLLLWEALKYASKYVNTFNFEGSMLPHIEPVFRHFGGVQTPYFRISKDRNKMIKLIRTLVGR